MPTDQACVPSGLEVFVTRRAYSKVDLAQEQAEGGDDCQHCRDEQCCYHARQVDRDEGAQKGSGDYKTCLLYTSRCV